MNSPIQQTIAAYDQYGELYDQEVTEFWKKFPQSTIKAFCDALPGTNILNLGSGSGQDAVLLRDQGLKVTCIDASAKMIELTSGLGFESKQQTFANMDLAPQSFDGVWAYTSLIHVPPKEAQTAIKEIAAALKPGGTFLIGVILGESEGMVERKTMPRVERYFKQYLQPEITQMVSSFGFQLRYEEVYQPHNSSYLSQVYSLK